MATLVLNAGTSSALSIVCQRAGKGAPRLVGSVTPSFAGALRSTVRGQAKVIPILASYVDTPTEAAIQAAAMNGAQIPCSGDILQNIQTLCSIDSVVSNMIPGLPGFFEMSFTVNEVNASTILAKYAPGDTITGETFTRSTIGSYRDANGNVASAAINVKRDGHYASFGPSGYLLSILLEDTRQNICLQSEVLGTTWTTAAATIGTNATTAPSGAVTADKIQEDNTNNQHAVVQAITCAQAVQTFSIWVKSAERSKCVVSMSDGTTGNASIGVDLSNGTTFASGLAVGSWTAISAVVESWGSSWYRVMLTATRGAGTATTLQVFTWTTAISYLGTTGNGLYAWGAQLEMASFASSYIATTTVAVTRGADTYSFPFTTPPQEMTAYVRFVDAGSRSTANATPFIISSAASATPLFVCYNPGFYSADHNPSSGVVSTLAALPVFDDAEELNSHLFGDGSVDIAQSINSGTSTAGAQSAAATLASAWSGQLCYLNSNGAGGFVRGFGAYRSFKIVAGARSLAEMRAA